MMADSFPPPPSTIAVVPQSPSPSRQRQATMVASTKTAAATVTPDRCTITSFETAESFLPQEWGLGEDEEEAPQQRLITVKRPSTRQNLPPSVPSSVDEEEGQDDDNDDNQNHSIPSNIGGCFLDEVEVDSMSRQELKDVVERLYQSLQRSGTNMVKEQGRRRNREKSLIKLVAELRARKERLDQCVDRLEELQEELIIARSERSLMEQRLDSVLEHDTARRDETWAHMSAELADTQRQHTLACQNYETRIEELRLQVSRQNSVMRSPRYNSFRSSQPQDPSFSFGVLAPMVLSMALPLTFLFQSEVGSKSSYVSFGLWSWALLVILQSYTATA